MWGVEKGGSETRRMEKNRAGPQNNPALRIQVGDRVLVEVAIVAGGNVGNADAKLMTGASGGGKGVIGEREVEEGEKGWKRNRESRGESRSEKRRGRKGRREERRRMMEKKRGNFGPERVGGLIQEDVFDKDFVGGGASGWSDGEERTPGRCLLRQRSTGPGGQRCAC